VRLDHYQVRRRYAFDRRNHFKNVRLEPARDTIECGRITLRDFRKCLFTVNAPKEAKIRIREHKSRSPGDEEIELVPMRPIVGPHTRDVFFEAGQIH
jgi:hypothetical protein